VTSSEDSINEPADYLVFSDGMIFPFIFAALAAVEYAVYFRGNEHFFQGDSIYYLYLRHRTIGDFLLGFVQLDHAGWYRPLAATAIQSLFYPIFGLEPGGYRIVQYFLFMAVVFMTYRLALIVTHSRLAATIAMFFFGLHTANAYTTYDVAFAPEIIYTFFYVCAAAAYMRFRESHHRRHLGLSIGFFIATLASKEPAVTLPVVLVALDLILNHTSVRDSIAAVRWHLLILAVYAVVVGGYLGVQRPAFQSILNRPGSEIVYRYAVDRTLLENGHSAVSWAFNLPRGWITDSRHMQVGALTFLKFFRIAIAVLGLWLMFRPERRFILAAGAWFLISVSPALPLFDHFFPYYLFLPLAGFSFGIGVIFEAVYRKVAAYSQAGAAVVTIAPLLALGAICATASRNDARDNRTLGGSSLLAFNSVADLKAGHPALQPNTTVYFSDAADPNLAWDTSQGKLLRMAYNDETIQALYWGWGEVITKGVLDRGPVIVLKYAPPHFKDITKEFLAASETPVSYGASVQYHLAVAPEAAKAGEKYRISISALKNSDVTVHYSLNGNPVHAFMTHLDDQGQASFDVTEGTERGVYKFVGFRKTDTEEWFQLAGSIQIN
jgi:hypothetical protein